MDEDASRPRATLDNATISIRLDLIEGLLANIAATLMSPAQIDRLTDKWNERAEVTIADRRMTDTPQGMRYQRLSDALLAKLRAAVASPGAPPPG